MAPKTTSETDNQNIPTKVDLFFERLKKRMLNKNRFGSYWLRNVTEKLRKIMPDAYKEERLGRKLVVANDGKLTTMRHKNSRTAKAGSVTLKVDVAGSGFRSFRADHVGFKGKDKVKGPSGREFSFKKKAEVKFYNKIFGPWVKGVRTPEQIKDDNLYVDVAQKIFDERFGKNAEINGKTMKHIYKKGEYSGSNVKVSMAGPLGTIFGKSAGIRNSGDYSIENLRKYILDVGQKFVNAQVGVHGNDLQGLNELNIDLRGHSRGGVACEEGAMMLKSWINQTYPLIGPKVKFQIDLHDPVAGLGSRANREEYDNLSQKSLKTSDGYDMEPLGKSADSTVVYSLHSDHSIGFTPLSIKGANRIILTPFTHMQTMKDVDKETGKREGLIYNGEAFGQRSYNDLPQGVYIVDATNKLIKLDSKEKANSVLDKILPIAILQGERHKILYEVANEWFDRNTVKENNKEVKENTTSKKSAEGMLL